MIGSDPRTAGNGAALASIVLALGMAFAGHARAAPAGPDLGPPTLRVEAGRLSGQVEAVPLAQVLRAIGSEAGIEVRIVGELGLALPQRLDDLPVEDGIRRLVGSSNGLVMLFSPDPPRLRAIRVYGTLGAATSLSRPDPPDEVPPDAALAEDPAAAMAAIRELAARRDDDAARRLATYLAEAPDPELRRVTAGALAAVGGDAAAAALEDALGDEDRSVRLQALRSLRMLRGEEAAAPLARIAREDEDPEVRRTALLLLNGLESLVARAALEAAGQPPRSR
ncbi:MAG TPA: HEAT repeat domain-containing protein [Geminicoccaceae bacterium]|nr:HEAT repeat domain-containing protein [Geminicoccaceae bacterium]